MQFFAAKFMHSDIMEEAALFYDALIPFVGNPRYMPKDLFIRNVTEDFLNIYGQTFKDFLTKNKKALEKDGFYHLHYAQKLFDLFKPPKMDWDDWEDAMRACRTFAAKILTQWAYNEKVIKKKDIKSLIDHLSKLQNKKQKVSFNSDDYIYPSGKDSDDEDSDDEDSDDEDSDDK